MQADAPAPAGVEAGARQGGRVPGPELGTEKLGVRQTQPCPPRGLGPAARPRGRRGPRPPHLTRPAAPMRQRLDPQLGGRCLMRKDTRPLKKYLLIVLLRAGRGLELGLH